MDDLSLFESLRPSEPALSDADRAALRASLFAGVEGTDGDAASHVHDPLPMSTTVTLIDTEATPPQPEGRDRRSIVAVAAALVAIVVGGLILAVGNDDSTVGVPVDTVQRWDRRAVVEAALFGVGSVGLPPVGAQPSTPARARPVLSISPCPIDSRWDGLSVYADGRLIWSVAGHLVEQRLNPEGVELMLSELRGSGLLGTREMVRGDDGDVYPGDNDGCEAGWYHGHIDDRGRVDGFEAPVDAHITRLLDPASWLPASAWSDGEIEAFVPSEYDIYVYGGSWTVAHTRHPALELPAAVQERLKAELWECQTGYCYVAFTTDEARALAEALDAAGFVADLEGSPSDWPAIPDTDHLRYRRPTSAGFWEPLHIEFYARLPQRVGDGYSVGP